MKREQWIGTPPPHAFELGRLATPVWARVPWLSLILLLAVVAGCGGGGGGNGSATTGSTTGNQGSAPSASITASPTSVTELAATSGPAPDTSIFTYVAASTGGGTYYIDGHFTDNGIASATQVLSGIGTLITLTFKLPAVLGPGTYDDTVTIVGCYDQACTQQVAGSPITIPVTYTVSLGQSQISSVDPTSVQAGSGAFTLQITGSGFTNQSVVEWDGGARPTTYVSPTELTAQINSSDVSTVSNATVSVETPGPAGSGAPAPFVIAGVSPASVTVGGPAFNLTVLGAGFDSSSVVQWNGSARPTTVVSSNELLAQISAADIASAAMATITVGSWTAGNVTIQPPSKDAVAYQINSAHTGAVQFDNVSLPASSSWSTNVGGRPSYALIADGKVFVTVSVGSDSQLLALDQVTGAPVWGPIPITGGANAAYDAGTVFVASSALNQPTQLQAYDASTGALKWSTGLGAGEYNLEAPPTAANGFVFQPGGVTLYAYSEISGDLTWSGGGGQSNPAVTGDGVYVSPTCVTKDLRPATGESIWSYDGACAAGGGGTTPVAAGGVLYALISGSGGTLSGTELDAETGTSLGNYNSDVLLAVAGQTGYFLEGGTLSALNLSTNAVSWTFTGDGQLTTTPVVVNQYVFVGSSSGNLYTLDAATGMVLWQTTLGAPIAPQGNGLADQAESGLAAGDGLLVVPAGDTVTAYTLSTSP
jgi:outer membrane protein assembly factor BamB